MFEPFRSEAVTCSREFAREATYVLNELCANLYLAVSTCQVVFYAAELAPRRPSPVTSPTELLWTHHPSSHSMVPLWPIRRPGSLSGTSTVAIILRSQPHDKWVALQSTGSCPGPLLLRVRYASRHCQGAIELHRVLCNARPTEVLLHAFAGFSAHGLQSRRIIQQRVHR